MFFFKIFAIVAPANIITTKLKTIKETPKIYLKTLKCVLVSITKVAIEKAASGKEYAHQER